ncbi:MAG: hypothetical protein SPK34_03140 [Bacteroidaceae bacterium]|nr:hypothetical protein [Prevotellaceae bacterium]MDY5759932.1 hypothetical protein [Bacteroidaceae bacterium]
MRRNLQRLMVVMAAMMICLGASAIDKIVKKVEMTGEVTSLEALKSATFMLQNGDVVLYTPSGWDIKVAAAAIATEKTDNGGFFALTALDDHYLIPVFNIDKTRRTFWAGNQSVNAQPGGNVIFGLDGDNAQHGQDGPNLAVWDVTYKEGEGFAFHCVGRNIYIGHDGSAARPVEAVTYWKAFTGFNAGYDVAAVEATAASVESALKVTDASATFASAKAAYEADKVADGALDKYVAAINAAIDVVNTCEQVNKTYAAYKLSTLGAAAVKDVVAKYNAGEYKDVAALDAAYLEAVKSQNCDGADMTGAIVNPSFELGNANGWTYAASDDHGAKENSNGTYTMSNNDGKYVFNIWPKGNAISQTIEGLPNGTYKLQAVIATDGGKKVQLNANDKNVQIDATGKETGVEGEVEFEVTDGKATIGAEGVDESWYKVDNFRLTLVKAAAVVPEKDAWYNQINFAAKDYADPNATYTDGVDFPDAPWAVDGEGNGAIKIVSNAKQSQSYESQFFMQIADLAGGKFNKNDKVILKYKAKAESSNETLTEIQAGGGFHGNYAGNQWKSGATGATIKVGEWTDIETELTITNTDVTNYSLDLTYDAAPITYYFDDFSFEYVKGKDDWYLNNKIYAKDFTKGDEAYENGTVFPAAPFKDGAVQVVSDANAEVDHGSQIFFEIPESLRGGEVELTMKVKASKEISVATALHSSADGNGWSGNPAGDKVDFKVGEWTEITRVLNTDCKDGKGNPIAYYVLNLSDDKGKEVITYQFDDLSIKKYYAPVEWGDLVEVPVEGTLVTEKDWTQETSFPYWSVDPLPEGCTRTIENGLVIENTKTDGDPWANQMFTLDGLTFEAGKEYVLRYTLKINGEGDIRADVGPWGKNLVKAPDTQTLENGYRQVVFGIGPCEQEYTGAHAIWQSRKFLGKIIIEKVELFDITPDYAAKDWSDNILKNGDLATDDMSAFILKNNDVENPEMLLAEKSAIGDGFEIGIETAARPTDGEGQVSGNDYDAQFFVRLPYVLPQGTLFNLEFDLYAEKPNTLAIQAHGEPGQYKGNLSSVTTDPKGSGIVHYQKYLSAPADMRSIAFNLAVADATTYGFSNIKVQIVNDDKATIEEATATADATTLWAETLALNEACYAGRIAETEGCTEASVKDLTDAIAAGKAALADPAPTKESLTAAAKAITDAIAGLKKDAPALAYTDLTKEMFFHWNAADKTAEALEASNCDYNIGTSTGQVYGLSTVNHDRFADLSAYNTIELKATEGEPRLLFNRIEDNGTVFVELPRDKDKYETIVDNGDGSKTYIIDIAAIVAEHGFAHLHAIKGANWVNTTVTEIKLGYVGEKPALPIPVAINGIAEGASVKDGKYFVNGQIVIVKGGKKFNAAGVEIK